MLLHNHIWWGDHSSRKFQKLYKMWHSINNISCFTQNQRKLWLPNKRQNSKLRIAERRSELGQRVSTISRFQNSMSIERSRILLKKTTKQCDLNSRTGVRQRFIKKFHQSIKGKRITVNVSQNFVELDDINIILQFWWY